MTGSSGKSHPDPGKWLHTRPGTLFELSTGGKRNGPCWRCRWHLRWPPWRKHWGCRMPAPPPLKYLP